MARLGRPRMRTGHWAGSGTRPRRLPGARHLQLVVAQATDAVAVVAAHGDGRSRTHLPQHVVDAAGVAGMAAVGALLLEAAHAGVEQIAAGHVCDAHGCLRNAVEVSEVYQRGAVAVSTTLHKQATRRTTKHALKAAVDFC